MQSSASRIWGQFVKDKPMPPQILAPSTAGYGKRESRHAPKCLVAIHKRCLSRLQRLRWVRKQTLQVDFYYESTQK